MKRIGFLATGSEIISGEVLNRDSALMAQQLLDQGMTIGEHLLVDDDEANLTTALQFLFARHDVIITTGGLGPTADDITRNIITSFVGKKLVFNATSWQRIVERFARRNIPVSENNKQQAYFPQDATVLPNGMGSADGCQVAYQGKTIFMLPGPPIECMPIFEHNVLPYLKAKGYASDLRLYRWRLMGVPEATIACALDKQVAQPYDIEIAYRAAFPYVDVKVSLHNDTQAQIIRDKITEIVQPYFVTAENETISNIIRRELVNLTDTALNIQDTATHGSLKKAILSPQTLDLVRFDQQPAHVNIKGLDAYWHDATAVSTTLDIDIALPDVSRHDTTEIPIRGEQTLNYAVEFCCVKLLLALRNQKK